MLSFLYEKLLFIYHEITVWLQTFLPPYGIILFFFLLYYAMKWFTKWVQKIETKKKEEIVKEIQSLPVPAANEERKGKLERLIISNPTDEDVKYQEQAKEIVKKHKGKPYRSFLILFVQIFFVSSIFMYLRTDHMIAKIDEMIYVAIILTIFAYTTRKLLLLNLIFLPIIWYGLHSGSGTSIMFYILIAGSSFIERIYGWLTKEKEEK